LLGHHALALHHAGPHAHARLHAGARTAGARAWVDRARAEALAAHSRSTALALAAVRRSVPAAVLASVPVTLLLLQPLAQRTHAFAHVRAELLQPFALLRRKALPQAAALHPLVLRAQLLDPPP
jgi:hypothetical protein